MLDSMDRHIDPRSHDGVGVLVMTPSKFKAIRIILGYTQRSLATRLGMARRQIQRYEYGEAVIPVVVAECLRADIEASKSTVI